MQRKYSRIKQFGAFFLNFSGVFHFREAEFSTHIPISFICGHYYRKHIYVFDSFSNAANIIGLESKKGLRSLYPVFTGTCWRRAFIDSPDSLGKTLTFMPFTQGWLWTWGKSALLSPLLFVILISAYLYSYDIEYGTICDTRGSYMNI